MRFAATTLLVLVTVSAHAAGKPDALAQAETLLDAASMSKDAAERYRLADEAAALCERAAAAHPSDPEPVFRLVRALTVADPDHPEACRKGRCEAALVALQKFRKLDAMGIEAGRIAAEEGIILSRMQRFAEALLAYERALPLIEPARRPNTLDERSGLVLLWGNSAETAMALGRLDDAIRRFELALDHATYGEPEWQLSLYGLGVALDRDGQVERARQTIARALEHDPALSRIHDESVFFEPPGDLYYYEGLAHEVAGDDERALASWKRYLVEQGSSRYAERARAHVAALSKRVGKNPSHAMAQVLVGPPMADRNRRGGEIVRERVQIHTPEIRVCYERFLREHPSRVVGLQLAIEISPAGFVGARARVLASTESSLELSRCVELAAESWRFPPLVGSTETETVLVPLELSPGAR